MRDRDDRAREGAQRGLDRLERLGIEVVGRLVEQQQLRARRRPSPPCAPARARPGSGGPAAGAPPPCPARRRRAGSAPRPRRARPARAASRPRARRRAGRPASGAARAPARASSTVPAAGTSTPERTSSSVVLPAPLGPVTATRSPRCSVRSTSASPRERTPRSAATRRRPRAWSCRRSRSAGRSAGAATARVALELAPQPALARLGLPGHLLGVALELRRRGAADGVLGVLGLAARRRDVRLQASSSLLLRLVVERELRPAALALGTMIAVAALVAGQRTTGLELEDAADDRVEERAVVRDDDDRPGEAAQPILQPLQAVAVEVVGRLVEEQHGGRRQQRARQQRARLLAARQPRQRRVRVEVVDGQRAARLVERRLQGPAAERLEALLRVPVALERGGRRVALRPAAPAARAARRARSTARPARRRAARRASCARPAPPAAASRCARPRRWRPRRDRGDRPRPAAAAASTCPRRWGRPGRPARRRRARTRGRRRAARRRVPS